MHADICGANWSVVEKTAFRVLGSQRTPHPTSSHLTDEEAETQRGEAPLLKWG